MPGLHFSNVDVDPCLRRDRFCFAEWERHKEETTRENTDKRIG